MEALTYNKHGTPPPPKPKGKPKAKLAHPCTWEGCDRMFSCPHNVAQHIREKHTGEKPYACSHCGARFARPYTLYRHLEGKHGIKKAGPGRGKGGGLARVGAAPAGVVKKRGRIGGVAIAADRETPGGEPSNEDPSVYEDASAYGVGRSSNADSAYEVNNFTPIPTTCGSCGQQFGNREALLTHQHDEHEEPYSRTCTCMLCLSRFSTTDAVDGAGVHVGEKGAAAMRDLMADDLFTTDEHEATDWGSQPAPASDAQQEQSEQDRAAAFFAATGMTEEQFTWNMPRRVAARARAREAVERDDLAQAVQGADVDAVDAWLKSAEEVFGAWNEGEAGMA